MVLEQQDYQSSQRQLVEMIGIYLELRPQIERLTALQWLIVHQLNTVVEDQSHKSRHVFVLDTLVERGELVDKYKGRHWPAFNPSTFPAIHKFLFGQLNRFVGKSLCTTSDLWLTTPQLVIFWRTAIQCYIYLLVSTKVKELRSVPLLSSCVREGRKFMSFVCSKQSTFMSLLDKRNISHFPKVIPKMLKELQSGNRLVHNILVLQAKTRKYPTLLKLAPSLRATSELFLKEIRKALQEAGLAEAISIVDGRNIRILREILHQNELVLQSSRGVLNALIYRVYAPVHGKICVVLCLFGVLTNLIHCAVLTRPSMRNSAVNCIMTAVALCDMGTMASYFIYIVHFVIQRSPASCYNTMTYWWMIFLMVHMFISITLHTSTLWLAVVMAFMRRMTLRAAILNSQWQKAQLAKQICFAVLGVVVVLSIPTLMVHEIRVWPHDRWSPPNGDQCVLLYPANYSELIYTFAVTKSAVSHGCMVFKTNLWLTGILFKVIPCLLLIVLSGSLMWRLRNAEKKRRSLLLNGGPGNDTNKSLNPDRTTAMLLAIVIVFLVTEFPQGVLAILNAIFTSDVHRYIYFNLGDLLDLMSLLNSSVNFILYCLMSSRYRNTFCSLILPISKCRCASSLGSAPFTNATNANAFRFGDSQMSDYHSRIRNFEMPELSSRRRSSPVYRGLREPSSVALLPSPPDPHCC